MAKQTKTCPPEFSNISACASYFYDMYNLYPSYFPIEDQFLNDIKIFPDPILKYVALYFYYNYSAAKDYFTPNSDKDNPACHNLNRWLDQHKSFFTHSEKCKYNTNQWNINIEPLWTMFEKYFGGNKCKRVHVFSNTTVIPDGLGTITCNKPQPEDDICYDPSEKNETIIEHNCNKLKDLCNECNKHRINKTCLARAKLARQTYPADGTLQEEAQTSCEPCPSLIQTIARPVSATLVGTLSFALFLYKFTPLGSKLSNRGRKKKRLQQQFMQEMAHQEFERSRNNNPHSRNGRSRLHYQSMQE
ncbi:PIR protein [Plasmodium vivax]|uniref:VIR protein n=1 Tax=Plasmodium vivax TaxID=5855 RepID=A0A564ZU37_PLAVI|nr:PIR protein [Plasmodium vivax]